MKRRRFIQATSSALLGAQLTPGLLSAKAHSEPSVRLGAPLFDPYDGPDQWVEALKRSGYRAAYCPVDLQAEMDLIRAYETASGKHDVVIAEVGAWSNPLSLNKEEAAQAVEKCTRSLWLADEVNARCCVNISGSRNEKHWAGPHEENLTPDTFDQVVQVTRSIIDAVKPRRTFFALEAMPWAYPDSTDTYLDLMNAIDRRQFGVHLDPVNMIRSPREYFANGALIRDMFNRLGPHIRSCHAKDITLREDNYIPQLDEVRAGLGKLDYAVYLQELAKLDDVPLMIEHLSTAEAYDMAAKYIRSVGSSIQISL